MAGATAPPPPSPEFSPKMLAAPALMLSIKFLKIDLVPYLIPLRIAYGTATLTTLLFFVYLRSIVRRKNETKEVTVIEKAPGKSTKKKMTTCEYDTKECDKKIQQSVISCAIVSFIHYKWGSPVPLLLQSVMQFVNLADDPMVQLHILNKSAVGKLARPFKTNSPLADLLQSGQDDDDAADTVPPPEPKKNK